MVQAELKVVGGKHHGQVIPLAVDKFLIGREKDCQLRPNTESISRYHCVLHSDEHGVRIRDLGSTNGTFVNDEVIQGTVQLQSGDAIAVGKLQFEIVVHETAPVVSAVEGEAAASSEVLDASAPDAPQAEAGTPVDEAETAFLSGDTVMMPAVPATPEQPMAPQMPMPGQVPMAEQPPMAPYPANPQQAMLDQQQQMMQQQLFQQFLQQQYMQQQAGAAMPQAVPDMPGAAPTGGKADPLPVRLPDPEDTGYREPAPTVEEDEKTPEETAEAPADSEGGSTKSNPAADIIKKYRQRRT
jgi:predicted component of type VI protein secretion system